MISYSFHLSSKSHALTTTNKVAQCSRHNLRQYKSPEFNRDNIEIITGTDSILDDVKDIYHKEFDEALKAYNEHVRSDRRIDDYLKHVSDSRGDVAAEIIIQIGDKEFWKDKSMDEKKQMSHIFRDQIRLLNVLCPNFKVASAVIHYDESSPHAHLIGVPVVDNVDNGKRKRGLSKKVCKTSVFTKDSLQMLQEKMREAAERGMHLPENQNLFNEINLKPREQGRNKDVPKHSLDEYYNVINRTKQKLEEELQLDEINQQKQMHTFELDEQLREKNRSLKKLVKTIEEKLQQLQQLLKTIEEKLQQLRALDKKISEHEDLKEVMDIYNKAYDDEIELGYRERARKEDWEI